MPLGLVDKSLSILKYLWSVSLHRASRDPGTDLNLVVKEGCFAVCVEARQVEVEVPVIYSTTGVIPFRLDGQNSKH